MRNAIQRKQRMIEYISDYRSTTRKELAKMFGVNERTVRRDIEELSCSYPIFTVQGNGGGIRAMDGWCLYHNFLSEEQKLCLMDLVRGLQPKDLKIIESILISFGGTQKTYKGC